VEEFIEAVDVPLTLSEVAGGKPLPERIEGYFLLHFLRQKDGDTSSRDAAIREINFSSCGFRARLGLDLHECCAYMIKTFA